MTSTDGAVLIDKPSGISSFKVLGPVKHTLAGAKVGHTGTLDPFASGLLIVVTGRMTKLASQFSGLDKTYEAVFRFGEETDTLDPEGSITGRSAIPDIECIRRTAGTFRGVIAQKPPVFSAVHVNGKRAYERARAGEEVTLPEREVRIDELTVTEWNPPDLYLTLQVSSGTYIRSIARDLAYSCGSCAYVHELRRTRVGAFSISEAAAPEALSELNPVIPPWKALSHIPGVDMVTIPEHLVGRVRNGVPLRESDLPEEVAGDSERDVALFSPDGTLLAVVTPAREGLAYRFVCS